MAKATPTKKARPRIRVEDIDAPFLKQNHALVWCIYFRASNKRGTEIARRVTLHTRSIDSAQKKFEKWLLSYKDPRGPGATAVALAPQYNATGEARKEQQRQYNRAHYARTRENGGAAPKPKSNGHAAPNREMLNAVMQQLSSTMQSMAASLRLLQITLGQDGN